MNPYAPYLLATLNMTEETKDKYPLGEVLDVQAFEENDRNLLILIFTKKNDQVESALTQHRSFLKNEPNEQNPEFITYTFGVPAEHRASVRECLARPDYPS